MPSRVPLFFCSALLAACVTTPIARGPMPVRNQHPAQLTILHLDPESAAALPTGEVAVRVDTAYTNMFLSGQGTGLASTNSFKMDGELMRTAVQMRTGLGSGFTVAVEVPMVHTSGGFLDGFLIDYHDLFGFPDQDRASEPRNQFNVVAAYQGETIFEQRTSALELADVPIELAYQVIAPALYQPGFSIRGGIELPTGNQTHGFGNGGIDAALGAVLELPTTYGNWYAAVQHTIASNPDKAAAAGVAFADVTSANLGLELPLFDDFALLLQTEWENSTLRALDFDFVATPQWLLWIGGRMRLDRNLCLEVAIAEDLAGYVSPDVTFWLGMAWLAGRSYGAGG
ncbi:MAG: DUF3187 family protein [Planctomycetota bacterium]|nr:DUF3187 family protein [Planctomycetota bacterium]